MDRPLLTEEEVAAELEQATKSGYHSGYTWLQKTSNFRHPSEPNGYIPGGPFSYGAKIYDPEWFKQKAKLSVQKRELWLKAWAKGINKYVTDNDLDFPLVELR